MAVVTINARLIYCDRMLYGVPRARHVAAITFDLPWCDPDTNPHFHTPVHMEWGCDGVGCEIVGDLTR